MLARRGLFFEFAFALLGGETNLPDWFLRQNPRMPCVSLQALKDECLRLRNDLAINVVRGHSQVVGESNEPKVRLELVLRERVSDLRPTHQTVGLHPGGAGAQTLRIPSLRKCASVRPTHFKVRPGRKLRRHTIIDLVSLRCVRPC